MDKKIPKTASIPVTLQVHFHIITLFPESLSSYIGESIIARAQKEKRLLIHFYNPRDFVKANASQKGKEKPYLRIDDKPYGGGPGMVIQAMPIIKALEKADKAAAKDSAKNRIIFLSPGGKQFTNEIARQWTEAATEGVQEEAQESIIKKVHITILCGRYEGIDDRVNEAFDTEKISVGPFVTTGGELPAMLIMDAVSRQIPGVLGDFNSREEERTSSHAVYTRPEVFEYKGKKYEVPEVLISGDHKKIDEWRAQDGFN